MAVRGGAAHLGKPGAGAGADAVPVACAGAPVLDGYLFAPRARVGILHLDGEDLGMMRERVVAYAEAGVQHVMVHPQDREIDDWNAVIEGVGRIGAI